ncbi:MAG: FAD binding domain-containing protein, partial [Candidatus Dormibacteraeota bacterium]|nr:FAD binding domain-containing protein [Candidatus Dormibacteraeota bacterium]
PVPPGDRLTADGPAWYSPATLDEALALRARLGDEAVVVAGGTFTGILVANRLIQPGAFIHLAHVPGLDRVEVSSELRVGAMVTHRRVEQSTEIRTSPWASISECFGLVASPRIRNQATVGGVLCDADYASDPPTLLTALGARVRLRSESGEREVPLADFIEDHYQTKLGADELLVEVVVPRPPAHVSYFKFRSRSAEDRPCVGVAVAADIDGNGRCRSLRVVVGAVSGRPQEFPAAIASAIGRRITVEVAGEIGRRYSELATTLSDVRGSAAYRSRMIAVLVRRSLEPLSA